MPDVFNMTNLTGSTDFVGMWGFGNEVTGGVFSLIILMVIFGIFFLSIVYRAGVEKAFVTASFTTMMSSWFFYGMGFVGVQVSILFLGLTLVAAFIVGRGRDE